MPECLLDRLAAAHELIARRVNYQPDLLVYAQLLQLMGQVEIGLAGGLRRGTGPRGVAANEAPLARPLLQDVFKHAHVLFGHSDRHIRSVIGKLVSLHLVRVEDERGAGKQLVFAPRDLVAQVRKLVAGDVDDDKLTYEYVSLDEFAAIVEVDRGVLLRKLSAGEFADDVFTFRRSEIMRLLDEKGRRYFVERKGKAPSEFTELADVEFADLRSIAVAVSRMDSFDLAKVLATLGEGDARARILGALPARRREDVAQDLKDLRAVDAAEAQLLGQQLIQQVKAAMLQRAA